VGDALYNFIEEENVKIRNKILNLNLSLLPDFFPQVRVSKKRGADEFDRKDGSGKIAWSNCILSDKSGQIRINAWKNFADVMDKQLAVGSAYIISGAEAVENRYSSFY
jgi:hypothetical protein